MKLITVTATFHQNRIYISWQCYAKTTGNETNTFKMFQCSEFKQICLLIRWPQMCSECTLISRPNDVICVAYTCYISHRWLSHCSTLWTVELKWYLWCWAIWDLNGQKRLWIQELYCLLHKQQRHFYLFDIILWLNASDMFAWIISCRIENENMTKERSQTNEIKTLTLSVETSIATRWKSREFVCECVLNIKWGELICNRIKHVIKLLQAHIPKIQCCSLSGFHSLSLSLMRYLDSELCVYSVVKCVCNANIQTL